MNKKETKSIQGIKISTLNFSMILISCILYIVLIFTSFYASHKYEAMAEATKRYLSCEKTASKISYGSNYLTDQVRFFILTKKTSYLDKYFSEIYTIKRRDSALKALKSYPDYQESYHLLQEALDYSNQLMEDEIYAMRLVAEAEQMNLDTLPKDVQNVALTAEDQALKPEEMLEKAHLLVFDTPYLQAKEKILGNINSYFSKISKSTLSKQQESAQNLNSTLRLQQFMTSILFIENLIIFILIIQLIIKPLHIYVKNIQEDKMLEITGSYEFKYLALTYNNIFELNAANETMLRHRAEHDPLTGIINRGAFDHLRQLFQTKSTPLALLIIDVDKFKLINDGYGHEVGDQVLKKVAHLLEKNFRSSDFPARIGGDEFAVILTDFAPEMQEMIRNKIAAINHTLLNPTDNLPKVSLSVGAAYSSSGFSNDLYHNADTALYQVKDHGRCGCIFYEEPSIPDDGPQKDGDTAYA